MTVSGSTFQFWFSVKGMTKAGNGRIVLLYTDKLIAIGGFILWGVFFFCQTGTLLKRIATAGVSALVL